MLFQDVTLRGASFQAKPSKLIVGKPSQTEAIETSEGEAQTVHEIVSRATQTSLVHQPRVRGNDKSAARDSRDKHEHQVAQCLQSVGGLMVRELAKNGTSSTCYSGFEQFLQESAETAVTQLFELHFDYDTYFLPQGPVPTGHESSLNLACTGVSWNATGSTIAVAYGRFDHSGWCHYRAALCLWQVFQPEFNPQQPFLVLETSSGLMCVAFHPHTPTLVAAGSFHGQVLMWDTEAAEARCYSSGLGDSFHREPVTKVAWVYDTQSGHYQIASTSGDGKILFWRVKDKLAFPVEGYVLHVPRGPIATPRTACQRGPVMGALALAFSPCDHTTRAFVVGSEGGAVVRCVAQRTTVRSNEFNGAATWTASAARVISELPPETRQRARRHVEAHALAHGRLEVTLATVYHARRNPARTYPRALDFTYVPHVAPVYDIAFSPFCARLFLTASADGTMRVYSTLQRQWILSMDVTLSSAYLYAAQWSRTRPTVVAAASEDGNIYVFDLARDCHGPVLVLRGHEGTTATGQPNVAPMFALEFNPRQRNFVAAGGASGRVSVWKLPWQLATWQRGDVEVLEALETTCAR